MRKIVVLVLSACMLFSMASCNDASNTAVFREEQFLEEIMPNIMCLDSCIREEFCAEEDSEDFYFAVYESESAYAEGLGEVSLLYKPGEEGNYADYFIDPTDSFYYTVTNFKTNLEVRDYLKDYLFDEVIDKWFSNDFFEYEGDLYLVRGSRGYGAITCDLESVNYIEEKDGKHYVTADFMIFDEFDHTETLEFSKINDAWIMTDEDIQP